MLQHLTRRVFTLRNDSPEQTKDDINETDIETIRQSEVFPLKNPNVLTQQEIDSLYQMGFALGDILTCWKIHKFADVEEAVNYLLIDQAQAVENKRKKSMQIDNDTNSEQLMLNSNKLKNKKASANEDIITQRETEGNNNNRPSFIKVNSIKKTNDLISRNAKVTSLISSSNSISSIDYNEIKEEITKRNALIISKIDISSFENPSLCKICYMNSVSNETYKTHFACSHDFYCKECIKTYLTYKIINGNVSNIECIVPDCNRIFTLDDVKALVSPQLFAKYRYHLHRKTIMSLNRGKYAVNCPYPDCEEIVFLDTQINEKNNKIICPNGHKFCGKCKELTWHSIEYCIDYTEEIMKRLSRSKDRNRIKMCPHCKVVIEKTGKKNEIICSNCSYKFCWLCLDKCEENHYSIFNITGCYGRKYLTQEEIDSQTKCKRCCLCWISFLALFGAFLFYLVFGCGAEFIKCYLTCGKKKRNHSMEEDENDGNLLGGNCCKNITCCQRFVCVLLFIIGLCCQPVYLAVYVMMLLIHCMKTIGCGMFLYIMNNH